MKYQETEFNITRKDANHISSNKESVFHYDFLFIILRKLIFLRNKYEDKFQIFGNDITFTFLSNKLEKVTSVSKY